jgi:hypothetical protein
MVPVKNDGNSSKIKDLVSNLNLINLLGKFERDNTSWSGYDKAPKMADWAGKEGIKIRTSPDWLSGSRPFVWGNNIFIPKGYAEKVMEVRPGQTEERILSNIIPEEMPHVSQFREESALGFVGRHLGELMSHGVNEEVYKHKHTHEGYHYENPEERSRLMGDFMENAPEGYKWDEVRGHRIIEKRKRYNDFASRQ